ncbi:hypothetical protein [Saccharothrix sp. ST-888]|uniref:hypothetical protein n=1 Tax=Saccharothrix sp. ST-888 TaxID=1427391 RepID=UPI0005ECC59E|nr:hypothetical protein [Saccharothrix sp. ST-888]KJK58530.1 hypothetical protein UK12_09755 [Saccharothrix sp. ST-888]
MKPTRSAPARSAAGFGLALVLAAGTTMLAGTAAHAQTVTSGTLGFGGDAGDYISGGQSYSYSTASQDRLDVSAAADDHEISISVNGAHGDWWNLSLAAPAGQALTPGTYTGATRFPFNGAAEPGLSIGGNGRGCNTLTGSFTVSKAVFGPNGYVQALDATYEQHCEGSTAALRGEVHIDNPAPPAVLDLGLGIAVDGTASALNGKATVHGTVACNKPVKVAVSGLVTQVKNRILIRGPYSTSVSCVPGAPVAWSAQADPTATTPFQRGEVEVAAHAGTTDPDYGTAVTADRTVAVQLTRTRA